MIEIITKSLDLLSDIELLNTKEQKKVLYSIIDLLGNYPKPNNDNNDLACYLFVSNVRNACKLSILKYLDLKESFNIIQVNLENTLSLLVDDLK